MFGQDRLTAGLMTSNSEMEINAEGIFISCSQGQTRLWEFHPDDVASVGMYSEKGRAHEVIVAVNRDFDVAQDTKGFEELNARLSIELKATITPDIEREASRWGTVLWPPHLAGSDLWDFYVIGSDMLARHVSPDAPDAERGLCRPLLREMARNAKPRLPRNFPQSLIDRGFTYHGDTGWRADDALLVAEWLSEREAAVFDAELWLVKNGVPQPHVRTSSGTVAYRYWTATQPSETWEGFANRALNETASFIRKFQWPENATELPPPEVRFCLGWVSKFWLEEDGFVFPK